jgi:hypothetical protein
LDRRSLSHRRSCYSSGSRALGGLGAVEENKRAEWRRVEELINIVYRGTVHGLWAQKLAVDELMTLKGCHAEIVPILREASDFFRAGGGAGLRLADHIDGKLPRGDS